MSCLQWENFHLSVNLCLAQKRVTVVIAQAVKHGLQYEFLCIPHPLSLSRMFKIIVAETIKSARLCQLVIF